MKNLTKVLACVLCVLLLCACAQVKSPETTAAPSGSTAAPEPTTAPATVPPPETLGPADVPTRPEYPIEKLPQPTLPKVSSTALAEDDPLVAILPDSDGQSPFLLELFLDGESRGRYPRPEPAKMGTRMPSAGSFLATDAEAVPAKTQVKVTREGEDWALTVHIETGFAVLDSGGEQRVYVTTQVNDVRFCYDEAEIFSLRAEQDTIPDTGQTYLEAAQELADAYFGARMRVSPGSDRLCKYIRVEVSDEPEETEQAREEGRIDGDTYAVRLDIYYVPDNYWSFLMCGMPYYQPYAGNDPDVPENTLTTWRGAFVSRTADGWTFWVHGMSWGGKM